MKVYKIRNKEGLFSIGGQYPRWTKTGKVWRNKGGLSNHLSLVNENFYKGCELIEYETIENAIIPMKVILEQKKLNKAERLRKEQEYIDNCVAEREKKLLQQLKNKYENQ